MSARMDGVEKPVGEDKGREALLEYIYVPPFMIHVGLVLFMGWLTSLLELNLLFVFSLGFAYLWYIENRQRRKIEFRIRSDERKSTDRKRLLSDAETARWLNSVVASVWPIFLEKFASEHFLMRLAPWFMAKYKPWTAKNVVLQKLYMGKSPPVFTFFRAGRHPTDGDHLVLEMTMNFSAARDMSAVIAVQMRKRLAGLWTTFHVSDIQIEGNLKVGVRFVKGWPVISRLRICFSDAPIIRMVAKPLFSHGVDVTDLPGIAAWLDKMVIDALEQSLVEPNLLVVDVEKLVGTLMSVNAKLQPVCKNLNPDASAAAGDWFHVGQKGAVATLLVEIIEGEQLKPCDPNGKSDPYVKIVLGKIELLTTIKRKTLSPSWHEQFRIPITNWASPTLLSLHVRDKDRFIDDWMGHKQISIEDIKDGQRHDMWLPLDGVKTGKLHIALTVEEIHPVDEKVNNSCEIPHSGDSRRGAITAFPAGSFKEVHDRSRSRSESTGESLGSESDETPLKDESEPVDVGVGDHGCVSILNPGRHVVKEAYSTERSRQRSRSVKEISQRQRELGKSSSQEDEMDSVLEPASPRGQVRRRARVRNLLSRRQSKQEDKKDIPGEDVSGELIGELAQGAHEVMIVGEKGSQVHMKLELDDEDLENLEDHGLQDELPIVPESGDPQGCSVDVPENEIQGCNVDGTEKEPESQLSKRSRMKKLGKGVLKQPVVEVLEQYLARTRETLQALRLLRRQESVMQVEAIRRELVSNHPDDSLLSC